MVHCLLRMQVSYEFVQRRELLEQLQQHLFKNIIKADGVMYLQRTGIAQVGVGGAAPLGR